MTTDDPTQDVDMQITMTNDQRRYRTQTTSPQRATWPPRSSRVADSQPGNASVFCFQKQRRSTLFRHPEQQARRRRRRRVVVVVVVVVTQPMHAEVVNPSRRRAIPRVAHAKKQPRKKREEGGEICFQKQRRFMTLVPLSFVSRR